MGKMEVSVLIDAPVSKVYRFVSNIETHPRFADICKSLKITSRKRRGVGVTFAQVVQHRGRLSDLCSRIVECKPNKIVKWVNLDPDGSTTQVIYHFVKADGGTKVVHQLIGKHLNSDEALRLATAENRVELAKLKMILERRR